MGPALRKYEPGGNATLTAVAGGWDADVCGAALLLPPYGSGVNGANSVSGKGRMGGTGGRILLSSASVGSCDDLRTM
jgi:hypothetical protein